jgi:hypothetical protein
MQNNDYTYSKKDLPGNILRLGYILLAAGLILGILGFFTDHSRAVFNYLMAFMFVMSIGVGALFLIALEYVVGADWSVPIRRVTEFLAVLVPLLVILVIPLLMNMHTLFHWSHEEAVAEDAILQGKSSYLNTTFFMIRVAVIFIIWILFYFLLTRNSRKQDVTKDQDLTRKNIIISAIFIPLFAITISVASMDWMMSLEPHWFSTIFGVYFFSGATVATLAMITFIVVTLKEKGFLHPRIINDHLYSLGALMFAFINFWGYIAFSQYILIWYADLPEENFWFLHRWEDGWAFVSLFLIFVHFVVPYALLLSQPAKMDPKRLKIAALWILFAHYVDLYWLIMPNTGHFSASWIDFTFPVFTAGLVIVVFNMVYRKQNILPVGDPKLERGLNFHL